MTDAGFFKGTSADQDSRFSDKELKLLKTLKFPPEFNEKVDTRKVNLQVMRPWVANKVTELVGFEDEVVVEYAMGLLEDPSQPTPDPRRMQINLTGFLTGKTPEFMVALWKLLLEAQASPGGIPKTFVEEKKEEMRRAREKDARALGQVDRRARLDEIRDRERAERSGGERGRGRGRGGRGRGGGRAGGPDNGRPRDSGWGARGGARQRFRSRSRSRTPPMRRRSITPVSRRPGRSPTRSPRGRSRSRTPQFRGGRQDSRSRSYSPTRKRLSRSRSYSPPPPRRRLRSPSYSPPPRRRSPPPRRGARNSRSPSPRRRAQGDRSPPPRRGIRDSRSPPPRHGARDSRSPPARRRRLSPPLRSPSRERNFDRPSPPHYRHDRRRSAETESSISRSRSRSRSTPPRRQARSISRSRSPPRKSDGRLRRNDSRSSSVDRERRPQSPDYSPRKDLQAQQKAMVVDEPPPGELKIKGQAGAGQNSNPDDKVDLAKRENELKERALRNKVVRTRKASMPGP